MGGECEWEEGRREEGGREEEGGGKWGVGRVKRRVRRCRWGSYLGRQAVVVAVVVGRGGCCRWCWHRGGAGSSGALPPSRLCTRRS